MATWNSAFEATPAGADDASLGDDKIRELKGAIRERLEKEHMMDLSTGTAAGDGWHESGSAKVYTGTSNPTVRPDGTTALTAADDGRLFVNTTTNKVYCYKHGTGWVLIGIAEMPIGTMYIQFYNETIPATLFGGTWTNVSSTYAGCFFRAEGGNASAFGAGNQAELVNYAHSHTGPSHTHAITNVVSSATGFSGAAGYMAAVGTSRVGAVSLSSSVSDTFQTVPNIAVASTAAAEGTGATSTSAAATETRPLNQTVRIWKRVS